MVITIHLHRNPGKLMGFCYIGHLCKVLYESILLAFYNILWLIRKLPWSYVVFKATHILAVGFSPPPPLFSWVLSSKSLQCHSIFSRVDMMIAWRVTPLLTHTYLPRTPGCSIFSVFLYILLLKMVGRTNYLQMLLLGLLWLCSSLFFLYRIEYFSTSGRLSSSFTYMVNQKRGLHISEFWLKVSLKHKPLVLTSVS